MFKKPAEKCISSPNMLDKFCWTIPGIPCWTRLGEKTDLESKTNTKQWRIHHSSTEPTMLCWCSRITYNPQLNHVVGEKTPKLPKTSMVKTTKKPYDSICH